MAGKDAAQKDGKAVTNTDKTEMGVRDYIAAIRKIIKAKKTLNGMSDMKEAVQKLDAKVVAIRQKIHALVDADIDARLKDE